MRSLLARTILCTGLLAVLLPATAKAAPQQSPAAADVNRREADGSTPLQWAVFKGDVDEVQRLIKAGANVALANNYGATPMGLAAEVGNARIIKLLLEAGADANSANPEGMTALMAVRERAMWKRRGCCSIAERRSTRVSDGADKQR
jgi:ankyrin repeat protein